MIFEQYRRNKWLHIIETTFGSLDTLEGDIHALESHHLSSIAKVAKRIGENGSFNQDRLRLILKIVVNDASLAKEVATAKKTKFSERYLEQVITEHKRRQLAKTIFSEIRPKLEQALQEGCKIDEIVCLNILQEIIIALGDIQLFKGNEVSHDEIITQFDEQFHAEPERFILNLNQWKQQRRQNLAEVEFNKIRPQLEQNLPKECSINKNACVKILGKIVTDLGYLDVFTREVSHENISQQFHEQFHANWKQFVDGLSKFFDRRSEEIFDQIEKEIEKENVTKWTEFRENLLKPIENRSKSILDTIHLLNFYHPLKRLERSACVKLIRSLLKSGLEMPNLKKQFMDTIEKSPSQYFIERDLIIKQDLHVWGSFISTIKNAKEGITDFFDSGSPHTGGGSASSPLSR